MRKGKNYVRVKNLCVRKNLRVRKKKFYADGGVLYFGAEVVVIVLLPIKMKPRLVIRGQLSFTTLLVGETFILAQSYFNAFANDTLRLASHRLNIGGRCGTDNEKENLSCSSSPPAPVALLVS